MVSVDFFNDPDKWILRYTQDELREAYNKAWELRLKAMLADKDELSKRNFYQKIEFADKNGVKLVLRQTSCERIEWFFLYGKIEVPIYENLIKKHGNISGDT